MAPSAKDDEAALGSMLTADRRVGALRTLGEGLVTNCGAADGRAHPHCHLALPTACLASKDATVHGGQ